MGHKTKIVILSALALIVVALIAAYIGRDALLNYYAKGKFDKLEKKYGLSISYARLHMPGINEIEIEKFSVVPNERDTLLTLHSAKIDLSLWKMLTLNAEVKRVITDKLHISFIKKDSISNYDFLFKKDKKNETKEDKRDYARKVSDILDMSFGMLPENGDMRDLVMSYRRDSDYTEVQIPTLHISDNRFVTEIIVKADNAEHHWMSRGRLNNDEKTVEAELYSKNRGKCYFLI
jgi:hypothetical protein